MDDNEKERMGEYLEGVRKTALEQSECSERMVARMLRQRERNELTPGYVKEVLTRVGVYIKDLFIYKSGKFGYYYMEKERACRLGGTEMEHLIKGAVINAFLYGDLDFPDNVKTVTVIGPAYGACGYSIPACAAFEEVFRDRKIIFYPGKTQLKRDLVTGKDIHYFPEKLIECYADSDAFVITEDIVNDGRTCREVGGLILKTFSIPVEHIICIGSRGGQTTKSLAVKGFFALLNEEIEQYDPRSPKGLEILNNSGMINTKLGKGSQWVSLFGQPPYPKGTDFSAFGFEKPVGK